MGKWTPGPWMLDQDQRHVGADGITFVGEVARLNAGEFARVAADRRLIAEAPAMAEALERVALAVELSTEFRLGHPGFEQAASRARAILARINGDAP